MSLHALYIDFNSYFASVEQHLRPKLRNIPMAVLPVMAETTCCIAASQQAKIFGVKTGTTVREARALCPEIIFVEARPQLYIEFHHRLVSIVESCSHVERTLSIDEMVCKLTGSQQLRANAVALADKIKSTIASHVGEQIRCSIGIAPNTFLAKVASNMQKTNGCVVIEPHELPDKLYSLQLIQLNGIGKRTCERLAKYGITTVQQLYSSNKQQLNVAWGNIEGEYMYEQLRGKEINRIKQTQRSIGHSQVLAPELRNTASLHSVLHRLLQKACMRLRNAQRLASTIEIKVKFLNHPSWKLQTQLSPTSDTLALITAFEALWKQYPATASHQPHKIGVILGGMISNQLAVQDLFSQSSTNNALSSTIDRLNMRFGKNTVYFAGAHKAAHKAPLRTAFNHIPDLMLEGIQLQESLI